MTKLIIYGLVCLLTSSVLMNISQHQAIEFNETIIKNFVFSNVIEIDGKLYTSGLVHTRKCDCN